MREIIENIAILQKKINELQVENKLLKTILDEANIDYLSKLKKPNNLNTHVEKQNKDIIKININEKTANLFYSMFWGRQDVYAKRYFNKKTGKSGYYPQCKNFWKNGCNKMNGGSCKNCIQKSYKTLNIENIIEHLKGNSVECNDVIGIYPLFANSTSCLLVFDFDNHNNDGDIQWKEEVDSLRQICIINGIDSLVERSRSGNGAHIWIFFDKPINANLIRKFASSLLEKGAEQINLKSYKYYDRILPNQDYLDENGLGNLIALPLQGQSVKMGNSVFVDENWNVYEDQIKILLTKQKLSKEFVEEKIREWNLNNNFGFENDKNGLEPWKPINLNKADIDGVLSIVLSNGIYVDTNNISSKEAMINAILEEFILIKLHKKLLTAGNS